MCCEAVKQSFDFFLCSTIFRSLLTTLCISFVVFFLVVRESGLYVMEGRPYIGASPDGLVECECCPKRVLEVKCPKTMKKLVQENMEKTKENVPGQKLRHTMTFFYQVQMQMNLTGVRHSVFVYISADDNLHIKVEFDEDYFQDVVERASCFFQKYGLPQVVCVE